VACGPADGIPPSPSAATPSHLRSESSDARFEDTLRCSLPVVAGHAAGFVRFPGGQFLPDPASDVSLPASDVPAGKSYDRSLNRWLPVAREWVSPDGKRYAYPAAAPAGAGEGVTPRAPGIHVVDATTGADRLFTPSTRELPTGAVWWVAGFGADGVYISAQPNGPVPPVGLWLMDTSSGLLRKIRDSGTWSPVGAGSAWGTVAPLSGHAPGPGTQLVRLNLKDGSVATWFASPAAEFITVGMDAAGHPLIETVGDGEPVRSWLVTAPTVSLAVAPRAGAAVPRLDTQTSVLEDGHGIWFGDAQGSSLSVYTATGGLRQVASLEAGPVQIAGSCAA